MIEVCFAHCDAPLPKDFHFNLPPPSEDALPRLWQRWKSRRMAHFLLTELGKRQGIEAVNFTQIQREANGRPYIMLDGVDFNMSHSGDWVAVMLSKSHPKTIVGIDIEHPQRVRRFEALLRHYADEAECLALLEPAKHPLPDLASRFYLSWCLREAILKTQGVGIMALNEVHHLPESQQLFSSHCPKGCLHFYHQLPFFLAYFWQTFPLTKTKPNLWQWTGDWQKIDQIQPLVYQVNPF